MRKLMVIVSILLFANTMLAQKPGGGNFGFGLMLGEPTGATIKYWTTNKNALDAFLGVSYFGELALGADYLWHFDAFRSNEFSLYAGPGLVIGFGGNDGVFYDRDDRRFRDRDGAGIAIRGIMGVNFTPRRSNFELFLELGPLIELAPDVEAGFDFSVGFRYYP